MTAKAPRYIVNKASELDVLGNALASYLSYDLSLLSHYKHWSLSHVITHSLLTDTRLLVKSLKKLSKIQCKQERRSMLKNIHYIIDNIYSYCKGLEYHKHANLDYLGIYKRELQQFRSLFHKWARIY